MEGHITSLGKEAMDLRHLKQDKDPETRVKMCDYERALWKLTVVEPVRSKTKQNKTILSMFLGGYLI